MSEQRIPNFIAVMHRGPDCVCALATPEFKDQVPLFGSMTGVAHETIPFDPYDFKRDFRRVAEIVGQTPREDDLVINFTGGTKIMSLSTVLSVMAHRGGRAIDLMYVDTRLRRVERLRFEKNGKLVFLAPEPIDLHIPFQVYTGLRGECITSMREGILDLTPARKRVMRALMSPACDGFFGAQKRFFSNRGKLLSEDKFRFKVKRRGQPAGEGSCRWDRRGAELRLPRGERYKVEGADAAKFLSGGWLEHYAFSLLAESNAFRQVLQNVVISFRPETVVQLERRSWRVGKTDKNELDVVVADGLRAAIIECKAGKATQDQLHKLSALRDELLGPFGVAILVTRHDIDAGMKERAKEKRIEVVSCSRIKRIADVVQGLLA